ncbi:MAG: DISARM system phospholipase D-like protein DrmC [Planctomycetes bacterium]|nr:DISARM system phospholipase D-like protein DrmC [Planctomycetota bacterium]
MNQQLAVAIAKFTRDIPEVVLKGFLSTLDNEADYSSRSQAIGYLPSAPLRQSMQEIFQLAAVAGVDDKQIALALECAFLAGHQWKSSSSWELVWTGPSPPNSRLRRTDQALLELIRSSRHELWVVSFAAYKVRIVTEALTGAKSRGVTINLVLESSEESEGRLSGDQLAVLKQTFGSAVRILVWPTENRQPSADGKRGMLHAKCAVCDDELLFISSANLTEAAMQLNIEMGVLARSSNHAATVQQHLRWMLEHRILKALD